MKQLTCELCGSTDLLKQEGVFVCQSCGTKYSVEEAKKMMIEGTVDVQGTVKVDNSPAYENYLQLAANAEKVGNWDALEKYTEEALLLEPDEPLPWFYKVKLGVVKSGKESPLDALSIGTETIHDIRTAIDSFAAKLTSERPFSVRENIALVNLESLVVQLSSSSWKKKMDLYLQVDQEKALESLESDINFSKSVIKEIVGLQNEHYGKINAAYMREFEEDPEALEALDEDVKEFLRGERSLDYLPSISKLYANCVKAVLGGFDFGVKPEKQLESVWQLIKKALSLEAISNLHTFYQVGVLKYVAEINDQAGNDRGVRILTKQLYEFMKKTFSLDKLLSTTYNLVKESPELHRIYGMNPALQESASTANYKNLLFMLCQSREKLFDWVPETKATIHKSYTAKYLPAEQQSYEEKQKKALRELTSEQREKLVGKIDCSDTADDPELPELEKRHQAALEKQSAIKGKIKDFEWELARCGMFQGAKKKEISRQLEKENAALASAKKEAAQAKRELESHIAQRQEQLVEAEMAKRLVSEKRNDLIRNCRVNLWIREITDNKKETFASALVEVLGFGKEEAESIASNVPCIILKDAPWQYAFQAKRKITSKILKSFIGNLRAATTSKVDLRIEGEDEDSRNSTSFTLLFKTETSYSSVESDLRAAGVETELAEQLSETAKQTGKYVCVPKKLTFDEVCEFVGKANDDVEYVLL